ncbi:unnamed protein product, partial [Oikopleura dioica]
ESIEIPQNEDYPIFASLSSFPLSKSIIARFGADQ